MSESPTKIRVLVVDDHAVVRAGLTALIESDERLELVGEAHNGEQALEQIEGLAPDVVVLDLEMPRLDGVSVLQQARRRRFPAAFLVLTSFSDDERVRAALSEGARGYILKESKPAELLTAIRTAHLGGTTLSEIAVTALTSGRASSASAIDDFPAETPQEPIESSPLTSREHEVLSLIGRGLRNREIACELGLSERTVRTHVGNILGKLDKTNRTSAVLYAIRQGWINA